MSYWDDVAADPERVRAEVWSDMDTDECVDLLCKPLGVPGYAVEVGCGPARLTCPVAIRWPKTHITAIDSSMAMIRLAERSCQAPNVKFMWTGGFTIPVRPTMADAVYSMTSFQHMSRIIQHRYIQEAGRVLKPGGLLRVQFVTHAEEAPLNHPTPTSMMTRWCQLAGMEVVEVEEGLMHREWCWITALR